MDRARCAQQAPAGGRSRRRFRCARLAIALLPVQVLAFDANGVPLGASEADVKKAFPAAHCKPLEWRSDAADRRCDDARIAFAGVPARFTAFLKADRVQAFDVRFDSAQRGQVAAHLKERWGAPLAEAEETVGRGDGPLRRIYKARWERGAERAVLTAPLERKRATLEIWRGDFAEQIYRIK